MKAVLVLLALVSLASCAEAPRKELLEVTCFVMGQPISGPAKSVKIEGTSVIIDADDEGHKITFVNTQCIVNRALLEE